MSRSDLTERMHRDLKQHRFSKKNMEDMVRDIFMFMEERLIENKSFQVASFGRFYVSHVQEKVGTDPQTHQRSVIPAQERVRFAPASSLKKRLR